MTDIFSSIGSNWIFWIILIAIIGFIVYSGIKKQKNEGKEKKKRENEVRNLIKDHIRKKDDLKNVIVNYSDVKIRTGNLYKDRDVYDVFVEIKNPRTQEVITRKAYEIEGFAKTLPGEEKEVKVNWLINKEFVYEKHQNLLNQKADPLPLIYLKSLFQKKPYKYIKKQKQFKDKLKKQRAELDKGLKKIEKTKSVFSPQFKKKEE